MAGLGGDSQVKRVAQTKSGTLLCVYITKGYNSKGSTRMSESIERNLYVAGVMADVSM